MRVIIFTDSLGRARPDIKKQPTFYHQLYFSLLKQKIKVKFDLILFTNESADTQTSLQLSKKNVAFRSPDIVIYHLGINDCSPRVFKKNRRPIIYRKWFKKLTFNIGAKFITRFRYRITKFRKLTYVSPLEFESNFTQMKNEVKKYSPNAEFMAISIAESFDWMNNRSFGHLNNVRKYNSILDKVFPNNVIHLNLLVPDVENRLIFDGVHLTKNAHQKIADSLFEKIQELKIEKKL